MPILSKDSKQTEVSRVSKSSKGSKMAKVSKVSTSWGRAVPSSGKAVLASQPVWVIGERRRTSWG